MLLMLLKLALALALKRSSLGPCDSWALSFALQMLTINLAECKGVFCCSIQTRDVMRLDRLARLEPDLLSTMFTRLSRAGYRHPPASALRGLQLRSRPVPTRGALSSSTKSPAAQPLSNGKPLFRFLLPA
jgi:hypothetical protein